MPITHPPNTEISAAIGRLVGCDISRAFPRQQDHPMTLPSCKATITLRVTRVRTRVKDHPLSNSSPAGGTRVQAVRIPRRSRVVRRKAPALPGASILLLSAGATAGLHNEIMLYQRIGHPDLWSKFHSASR